MINFSFINQIFIFLTISIGIWMAFWVYFANRKAKVNKMFFLMTISILLWVTFAYFAHLSSQFHHALSLRKLAFGASSFFFVPAYFFTMHFPIEGKRFLILDKIVIGIGIFFCLCSVFTNLIVENIQVKEWGTDIILGKGIIYLYGAMTFLTFIIIAHLIKKYFKVSKQQKLKVQYFLIGILFFALMNLIFNVFLPFWRGSVQYYQFGDYSTIFFLGFTAFAIAKRELFEMKVVVTSIFVALITILLALDALLFTEVFTIQALKGIALAIFLIFGYMLIKSVFGEVKRRKELEKLSRAKSEFISMASHQLRTPLTAIKGYSSLILEGTYGKANEKQKKVFKNIFTSSERLIKIVNDLLSISKIELGKVILEKEPVRIEKLIDSVYQEMKPLAQEKDLKLIWQKPKKPLPEINIDSLKIRQAIFNIIDNAIKYTEKGNITIKIQNLTSLKGKLLASYGADKIQIVISDTGRGFTKEEKNRVFELFVRGRAGIDTFVEGTGIGINVARKFVELHSGKIRAESQGEGKGATFYIELPITSKSDNNFIKSI
ncbi:hypothetical protein KAT95_02555 [Candidatus Parcubacteria bacterium]|nr:hypothetical protein [Candidatus Parcubacteria bacterium]